MVVTEAKLERVLADMGDSSESIAAFLEGQCIKGFKKKSATCAVAVYLDKALGLEANYSVLVGIRVSVSELVAGWRAYKEVSILTPDPVYAFTEDFDNGKYPNLVDPSDREESE